MVPDPDTFPVPPSEPPAASGEAAPPAPPSAAEAIVKQLGTVGFPAAPEVVVRLSQLLLKEWVTAEQLAEVAMLDAGVSVRVLRLANSVYYRGRGVKSIPEAVIRIGVDGVREVVYALSLMRALRPMQFGYRHFWRHSLAVAETAQILLRRSNGLGETIPELHAAGLMHDLGMLVLDRTLGVGYGRVLAIAHETARPLHEVEREMLDTEHADVGGRLLQMWGMPERLSAAVTCHHDPLNSPTEAALLVHLADYVVNLRGVHHGTAYRPDATDPEVWKELGIPQSDLGDIIAEVDASMAKADAILAAAS